MPGAFGVGSDTVGNNLKKRRQNVGGAFGPQGGSFVGQARGTFSAAPATAGRQQYQNIAAQHKTSVSTDVPPPPPPPPPLAAGATSDNVNSLLETRLGDQIQSGRDLSNDVVTQSLLADYGASAEKAREQTVSNLSSLGLLRRSLNTADVLGEFESGVLRGEAGIRANRAQQLEGLEQQDVQNALALSQTAGQQAEAGARLGLDRLRLSEEAQSDELYRQLQRDLLATAGTQAKAARDAQYGENLLQRQAQTARDTALGEQQTARDLALAGFQTARDTAAFGQQTSFQTAANTAQTERDMALAGYQTARDTAAFAQQTALQTAGTTAQTERDSALAGFQTARDTAQFGENVLARTSAEQQALYGRNLQERIANNALAEATAARVGSQGLQRSALDEQIAAREAANRLSGRQQNLSERATMAGLTGVVGGGAVTAASLGMRDAIQNFRAREGFATPDERAAVERQVAEAFTKQTGRQPTPEEVNDLFGFRTVNPGGTQTLQAQQLAQQTQDAQAARDLQTTLQTAQFGENQLARAEVGRQAAFDRSMQRSQALGRFGDDETLAAQQLAQQETLADADRLARTQLASLDRGLTREQDAGKVMVPGLGWTDTIQAKQLAQQASEGQAERDARAELQTETLDAQGRQAALDRGFQRSESGLDRSELERERKLRQTLATQGNRFQLDLRGAELGAQASEAVLQRQFAGDQAQAERQRLITESTRDRDLDIQRLLEGQRQFDVAGGRQESQFDAEQRRLINEGTLNRGLEIGRLEAGAEQNRLQREFLGQESQLAAQRGLTAQTQQNRFNLDLRGAELEFAGTQAGLDRAQQDRQFGQGQQLTREQLTGQIFGQGPGRAPTESLAARQLAQQGGQFDQTIAEQRAGRLQQGRQFGEGQELAREELTGRIYDPQTGRYTTSLAQQAGARQGDQFDRTLEEQVAARGQQAQQFGASQNLAREELTGQIQTDPRSGPTQSLASRQLDEVREGRLQQGRQFGDSQQLAREELTGRIINPQTGRPEFSLGREQLGQQNRQFNAADALAREQALGRVAFEQGGQRYTTLDQRAVDSANTFQEAGITGQFKGQDTLQQRLANEAQRSGRLDELLNLLGVDIAASTAGNTGVRRTLSPFIDEFSNNLGGGITPRPIVNNTPDAGLTQEEILRRQALAARLSKTRSVEI